MNEFFGPSGAHTHKATNGSDTLLGEPHRTLTFASPNTYSLTVPGTVAAVAATAGVRRGDSGPVAVAVATDRDNNRRSSLGPWRTPHAGRASSTVSLPHPYPYTILASPLRPATDATGSKSHTRRRGACGCVRTGTSEPLVQFTLQMRREYDDQPRHSSCLAG